MTVVNLIPDFMLKNTSSSLIQNEKEYSILSRFVESILRLIIKF